MDKNKCNSCGKTECACKNKDFTKAVIEIDNPGQITMMRKVVIPASMGDDTTVPPVVGKYHNVLLYYEANSKSYLYSSDGIPTQLVNGITDYEAAVNLPQINGVALLGDQSAVNLGLQDKLTAGANISINENNVISSTDTTYGPATESEIGLVKPGTGLAITSDGTLNAVISDYSTNEVNTGATWIDGSPIYKKTIDTGVLPNNTMKTVQHGVGVSLKRAIKIEGYAYSTNFGINMTIPDNEIKVQVAGVDIEIYTSADLSMFTESYVTLYYTKTQ